MLKYCNDDWLSQINSKKICTFVKQGQQIVMEGTPATGIYFVYSGKIKIHKTGLNDRNFILKLAKEGDIIGHCGFGGRYLYPSSATALEDSNLCFIENTIFFELLKDCHDLTHELMRYYTDELRIYESRMVNLAQMNVREKVADTLLLLRDTYGEDQQDKSLNIILSRQELAEISGTTKEQVSKMLTEFDSEKIIRTSGKKISILDDKKLLNEIEY
ncbi:MAG TPA: Crp/Fnr family transcriptional regulator [Bacteroidia bacterium]